MSVLDRCLIDGVRENMIGDERPPQHRLGKGCHLVLLVQKLWCHIDWAQFLKDVPGKNIMGVVTDSSSYENGCFLFILEE